nr:uncharacterized protein LOC127310030 [Lolium perenne]
MTTDHREYDRLVMQIDALALQHFPASQVFALKKVREDRIAREFPNLDAHWDGYDYLVALSARVQHMRSVDRLLADLPAAAIQVFKVLWPEEELPGNITLTASRLNDAGHRIREWQCSAARAGADTALRSVCSWYPALDLDALQGVRADAPTDTDPALSASGRTGHTGSLSMPRLKMVECAHNKVYNVGFHWILLNIKVDKGIVEVSDPLNRGLDGFHDLQEIL